MMVRITENNSQTNTHNLAQALSEEELTCLTWIMRGKVNKQISKEMNISEERIFYLRRKIREKTNTKTLYQAIAIIVGGDNYHRKTGSASYDFITCNS